MPSVRPGESENDYVSRAIPVIIKEGTAKDSSQAAAIAHSMWRQHRRHAARLKAKQGGQKSLAVADDPLELLASREASAPPGWSYKLAGGTSYGLESRASLPKPVFDDGQMCIRYPFAASISRDRQCDFLEVEGIDTSFHRDNPVAFLDHGKRFSLPIGLDRTPGGEYTVRILPDEGLAVCDTYLSQRLPEAEQVYCLYKEGILASGSIGYRAKRVAVLPADREGGFLKKGLHLLEVELLETTICGLPANGDAVLSDRIRRLLEVGVEGKSLCPALAEGLAPLAAPAPCQVVGGWEGKSEFREADHPRAEDGRFGSKPGEQGGGGKKPARDIPDDDPVHGYRESFEGEPASEESLPDVLKANEELESDGSKYRIVPGKEGWRVAGLDELEDEYGEDWKVAADPLTGKPEVADDSWFVSRDDLAGDPISASYVPAFNEDPASATVEELETANGEMEADGSEYRLHYDDDLDLWVAQPEDDYDPEDEYYRLMQRGNKGAGRLYVRQGGRLVKTWRLRRRLTKSFNEADHPRADDGRFGSKPGEHEGGGEKPATSEGEKPKPGSYEEAHQKWEEEVARLEKAHEEARAARDAEVERIKAEYKAEHDAWDERRQQRDERESAINDADPVEDANSAERTPAVGELEKAAQAWQEASQHRYDEGGREKYVEAAKAFGAAQVAAWQAAYGPDSPCRKELAALGASEQDLARYDALVARELKDQQRDADKLGKLVDAHAAFLAKLDEMEANGPDEPEEPEEPEEEAPQAEWDAYEKAQADYEKAREKYDAHEEKLSAAREKEDDLAGKVDDAQRDMESDAWADSADILKGFVDKVKERLVNQLGKEDDRDEEPTEEPDDDELPGEPEEPDYPDEPDPDDFEEEPEPEEEGKSLAGKDAATPAMSATDVSAGAGFVPPPNARLRRGAAAARNKGVFLEWTRRRYAAKRRKKS